jgi:Lrp/AsnC family transcriptional regulator, leucine-responsive regulatory protein
MKLDAIDQKILEILQQDGRITNAKLASIIGISPSAILKRVRQLEESEIICRYVALVNRDKVGVGVLVIVTLSLDAHKFTSIDLIQKKILAMKEVLECHQISGKSDFLLKVALASINSYSEFAMDKLSTIPGVQNIKSHIVLASIKNTTCCPINVMEA